MIYYKAVRFAVSKENVALVKGLLGSLALEHLNDLQVTSLVG